MTICLIIFDSIPDPRQQGKIEHSLVEILVMTVCAVISNCEYWEEIAVFCIAKEDWFGKARFGAKKWGSFT